MLFQSATLENTEIIFCRQSPSRLLVWYVCNRTLVTTVLQCVYHVMESLYCSCYKSYIWKSKKKNHNCAPRITFLSKAWCPVLLFYAGTYLQQN